MTINEPIKVFLARPRPIQLLTWGLLWILIALVVFSGESPRFVQFIVIFFTLLAFLILRRTYQPHPEFIIEREGIRSHRWNDLIIPWHAIEKIGTEAAAHATWIIFLQARPRYQFVVRRNAISRFLGITGNVRSAIATLDIGNTTQPGKEILRIFHREIAGAAVKNGDAPIPLSPEHALVETLENVLPPPKFVENTHNPLLTQSATLAMVIVYLLETQHSLSEQGRWIPSSETLERFGAMRQNLVVHSGEYYRIFTSIFVHIDPAHLVLNCMALFIGGMIAERLMGRVWTVAGFLAGGLGGALLTLWWYPASILSCGASGAILGLLAAATTVAQRIPDRSVRNAYSTYLGSMLIPSLLPLTTTRNINVAAHLGGALAGVIVALCWLKCRRGPELRSGASSS